MAEGARVRLEVMLECGRDRISGTVDDHEGEPVQFGGWLELMSALDAACARADADDEP